MVLGAMDSLRYLPSWRQGVRDTPWWRRGKGSYQIPKLYCRRMTKTYLGSVRSSNTIPRYRYRPSLRAPISVVYSRTIPSPAMASYKRKESINLDEPIDLSTKTEKEVKTILAELHNRYRINMVNNAQLDNEKQALHYQVEDVQDQLEVEAEKKSSAAQELKDWNRRIEGAKRRQLLLDLEIERLKTMITDRDQIIKDNNLVLVEIPDPTSERLNRKTETDRTAERDLLNCLQNSPGTFDKKIQALFTENESIKSQISKARRDLSEVREDNLTKWRQPKLNTAKQHKASQAVKLEQEQQQLLANYKQEVIQAGLKIDSLDNQLLRLEAQMHRYREAYEQSESMQQQLKSDNRKIRKQREESNRLLEELQREYEHLRIRVDKVGAARINALNSSAKLK